MNRSRAVACVLALLSLLTTCRRDQKLVSQASKLPVPQVTANAGAPGRLRIAPSAHIRSRRR